jgi:hypothetical protein
VSTVLGTGRVSAGAHELGREVLEELANCWHRAADDEEICLDEPVRDVNGCVNPEAFSKPNLRPDISVRGIPSEVLRVKDLEEVD